MDRSVQRPGAGPAQGVQVLLHPGWQEPNVTFELDVNLKAWETLPDDLKAIVRAAARDVNGDMLDDYNAKNMEALEQLREQAWKSVVCRTKCWLA